MCDYSLGGLPNRLAVEGENLIVHRFPTNSIGLASQVDLQPKAREVSTLNLTLWQRIKDLFASDCVSVPAVCIPPGACLILRNIPLGLQREWGVSEEENIVFVQTSAAVNTYRDAFCFRNGRQVSLQQASEGILAKVVSLGGNVDTEREPAISFRENSTNWERREVSGLTGSNQMTDMRGGND